MDYLFGRQFSADQLSQINDQPISKRGWQSWFWGFLGLILIILVVFFFIWFFNKDDQQINEDNKDIKSSDLQENVKDDKQEQIREDVCYITPVQDDKQEQIREDVCYVTPVQDDKQEQIREDVCYVTPVQDDKKIDLTVQNRQNNFCYVIPEHTNYKGRSKGETICCQVMTELFGVPFVTKRPTFLKNPETGRNLELDCYNEELKIAVEYNGIQHYNSKNPFHKTEQDFIKQVQRDKLKIELCDRNGVYLITVPYTVPLNEIRNFIISKLPPHYKLT